jgi:hypothetical protein
MAEVTITPLGPREFEVAVAQKRRQTTHRVSVPPRLANGLELETADLESVVRESFDFLLEREPASSILTQFSLDVISRYFPEYPEELARRLG